MFRDLFGTPATDVDPSPPVGAAVIDGPHECNAHCDEAKRWHCALEHVYVEAPPADESAGRLVERVAVENWRRRMPGRLLDYEWARECPPPGPEQDAEIRRALGGRGRYWRSYLVFLEMPEGW